MNASVSVVVDERRKVSTNANCLSRRGSAATSAGERESTPLKPVSLAALLLLNAFRPDADKWAASSTAAAADAEPTKGAGNATGNANGGECLASARRAAASRAAGVMATLGTRPKLCDEDEEDEYGLESWASVPIACMFEAATATAAADWALAISAASEVGVCANDSDECDDDDDGDGCGDRPEPRSKPKSNPLERGESPSGESDSINRLGLRRPALALALALALAFGGAANENGDAACADDGECAWNCGDGGTDEDSGVDG